MDHACYRCNAAVEDGVPFCPQCNSPQIRVAISSVEKPFIQAEEFPSQVLTGNSATHSHPAKVEWARALPSAALAAVVAAILVIIPLKSGGLGMLAAGALSTFFYRFRNRFADLTTGMGARVGALSGALGFGFFMLMLAIVVATLGDKFHQMAAQYIQQYFSGNNDPEMQKVLELYKTPRTFWWMMGLGSLMSLILSLILSAIGGAVAAALLRAKERLSSLR